MKEGTSKRNGIARLWRVHIYIELNLDVYSLYHFGRFFFTEKSVKCHYQDQTLKDKYNYYVTKNGGWTWNIFPGIGLGIA